jgi:GNAT superfamily N-acetyltransferase
MEAALIEAIERDAWADMYAAAPDEVRAALRIEERVIDDGALLIVGAVDNLQFNRLAGLGFVRPPSSTALDEAIAGFDAAGLRDWIIQVPEFSIGLGELCEARGLTPHPRTWAKFHRDATPVPAPPTSLSIEEVAADRGAAFGAVAAAGFGLPPIIGQWLAALPGRAGWRCFVGFDGPTPVAAGALFVNGRAAWLGIAATLPAYRGRGGQPAILAARIEAARLAGAEALTTETGIPHDNEPAPSFNNIQRAGFKIAYRRPNYRRAPR